MTDDEDQYGTLNEAAIFAALAEHDVAYVLVGGSGSILWGATRATRDVDCVTEATDDNHRKLCDALRAMGTPRLRIEGVDDTAAQELSAQLLHPDFFARTEASTWRTDSGSIDILRSIPSLDGTPRGYLELRARATFTPSAELPIPVASLADIIDSKAHANRQKDRDALPELRNLLDQQQTARE